MSECPKLVKVVTAIYEQIELTMLEAHANLKVADRFTLRMSFQTFQRLLTETGYHSYIYIDLENVHSSTIAGYSVNLQNDWNEENLIYLHYDVTEAIDFSKTETAFGEMQLYVPSIEKCSRGVDFEW